MRVVPHQRGLDERRRDRFGLGVAGADSREDRADEVDKDRMLDMDVGPAHGCSLSDSRMDRTVTRENVNWRRPAGEVC